MQTMTVICNKWAGDIFHNFPSPLHILTFYSYSTWGWIMTTTTDWLHRAEAAGIKWQAIRQKSSRTLHFSETLYIVLKTVRITCKDKHLQIRQIIYIEAGNVLYNRQLMEQSIFGLFSCIMVQSVCCWMCSCLSCVPSGWHSCYTTEYRKSFPSAITFNVPRQCLITEPGFLMTLLKFV